MRKMALVGVIIWLLWSRTDNPPNHTPSWMPLRTFGTETACNEAAIKAADSVVNSQDWSSGLALLRPINQKNVILAYFNGHWLGVTVYTCAEADRASRKLDPPSNTAIPSYQ